MFSGLCVCVCVCVCVLGSIQICGYISAEEVTGAGSSVVLLLKNCFFVAVFRNQFLLGSIISGVTAAQVFWREEKPADALLCFPGSHLLKCCSV